MTLLEIDGVKLYYEDHGSKEEIPIIFLHGWMASSELWMPQVDHFKSERRIIVTDFRGHGKSSKPMEKYSIERFSEDLYLLMDELEIGKATLVGHSMGGMTALRFTLNHPEKVETMILIDTLAKSSYSLGRKIVLVIAQFAMSIAYESFMRYYISSAFGKDYPKRTVEKSVEKVLRNPRHVVKSCFSATRVFDVVSELDKIRVPTLIIHGSESLLPVGEAEYMSEHIPNAELLILEGAGHSIPVETPEKIWEAIEEFI